MASRDERDGLGQSQAESAVGPGRGLRVLVADDDPGTRLGLRRLLEDEGFLVDLAPHGVDALEVATRSRPDVVLTDVSMPVMDGIELCRHLHELYPTMPVLVMTASDAISCAVEAMRAGAVDYLVKPLEFTAALIRIHRALETSALLLEREQLLLRQEALREEALAAVRAHEEVISIVSHDLRNALQVVDCQAHLLAEATEGESAEGLQAVGERLLRTTMLMSRLVADLLDESRVRAGQLTVERTRVGVSDVLADMSEHRPLVEQAGAALRIDPLATDPALFADRGRLRQVFSNLITNAIKFGPPGGSIGVSVQESAAGLCFGVRDDGPGIAPEQRSRIFGRFSRGPRREGGGLGLGLYIARAIVEAHGGRIWVESEPGQGTMFRVLLPIAASTRAESGLEVQTALRV